MLGTFILLNFFLAIIMSSYDRANEILDELPEARKTTLLQDIVGAWRNAMAQCGYALAS